MNSVERVKKAIAMQRPDRIPLIIWNRDFEKADIVPIEVIHHFMGENKDISEFGFVWEREDDTMGQPREALLQDWEDFDKLQFPDPYAEYRFQHVKEIMDKYRDKYYAANMSLTGFTVMTFIRGFEDTLIDLSIDPENLSLLADKVFGFEEEVIKQLKRQGFHAVAFFDDWGTQNNLMISPKTWREFFKPRYKKQFDLCHEQGLDVYFHSCGYILEIIDDLIEIGVDILNLSQPNIFDIEQLGEKYKGRVCFMCPVSYQTTSLTGTREEIFAEAKRLMNRLTCNGGGLIGYAEEYQSIGMSEENYQSCIDAFLTQLCG